MPKPTNESRVKRDLRTPKYRMKVEEDRKKELDKNPEDVSIEDLEDMVICDHGFLTGCPTCSQQLED